MNNLEIKEKIDLNNKIIQDIMSPNVFVLNNTINELLRENEKLQAQCTHEFDENGFCIYCYKEEY